MFDRQSHLDLFSTFDLPVIGLTAECRCRDFVTPAKARGWPPFALLLHGIARASLDLEHFRHRLHGGEVHRVERLTVGYTVVGAGDHLNFSNVPYSPDFREFLERYLADREEARRAPVLRVAPEHGPDIIYVTCVPWLRFTSVQHPSAGQEDCSIPRFAVGQFAGAGAEVAFPFSVQAHHGLVDGLHIYRMFARLAEVMAESAEEMEKG
ncbi:MAG: CatA-like O-acetyltransferase [Holophaga sp.]|jgi:chloramphenicol O-acetyltransferase type A